ncbi:transmembrane protein 56-like [Neltuma alba]|uniref:transmembrane protein 56-like n=1 Tax=Neltuma alba TaxID=207710 RepID=UPI0010A2B0F5|nr:transmembrane protein 56-like [Prosopis alba]
MEFMFPFPLPIGSISSREYAFWVIYSHCPAVVAGILLCILVYGLTAWASSLLFKGYGKLSSAKRMEWNNRGISTVHALFVAFSSFYLLIMLDMFHEDSYDELIVNRSSDLSDTVLGISVGYFLTDLAMILWEFPVLGGLEYVLHHGLSLFSIILSLLSGRGQIYVLMVLLSESTTPFVNLRWYLDVAGLKNSKLYIGNGVALFLSWLIARILLFIFFFAHMWIHFDEIRGIYALGFYSLIGVPPVLAMMNVVWFWKIAKGLFRTISKANYSN